MLEGKKVRPPLGLDPLRQKKNQNGGTRTRSSATVTGKHGLSHSAIRLLTHFCSACLGIGILQMSFNMQQLSQFCMSLAARRQKLRSIRLPVTYCASGQLDLTPRPEMRVLHEKTVRRLLCRGCWFCSLCHFTDRCALSCWLRLHSAFPFFLSCKGRCLCKNWFSLGRTYIFSRTGPVVNRNSVF